MKEGATKPLKQASLDLKWLNALNGRNDHCEGAMELYGNSDCRRDVPSVERSPEPIYICMNQGRVL